MLRQNMNCVEGMLTRNYGSPPYNLSPYRPRKDNTLLLYDTVCNRNTEDSKSY